MADTLITKTQGTDESSSHPIYSTIQGTGPNGTTIRSTIDGTGDPTKRIMSDVAPVEVKRTRNIDPIAAHIKEINHIDPVSIESLRVTTVRDVEPLRIDQMNVTHIPTLSHTVRQMPAMDMSVRRVPPMSVGLHQRFEVQSDYTMRATVLGVEVARLSLKGASWITPHQMDKPERHIERNKSYPVEAVAGNPAIPVNCRMVSEEVCPAPCAPRDHAARPRNDLVTGARSPAHDTSRQQMHAAGGPGMNISTISPGGLDT